MKLSELSALHLAIRGDKEFSSVGHLLGDQKDRIVPICSPDEIPLAIDNNDIAAIIVTHEHSSLITEKKGLILSSNPVLTALQIQRHLNPHTSVSLKPLCRKGKHIRIHPTACIAETAIIGERVIISEYATVGEGTRIGDDVFIGPHTHVGGIPGFCESQIDEYKSLVCGVVIIESKSNIQSHCIIERPLFSDITRIGSRCHIDSQSTIRQGSHIGNSTLLAALVTIGEFVHMGEECWAGPRSHVGNGIIIEDDCYITLGSVVTKNIKSGMVVRDNYAIRKERFSGVIP